MERAIDMNSHGYTLSRPAGCWEEGILCGNGTLGAIVMGNPEQEKIIFSHERLVIPFNGKERPIEMSDYLPAIRKMIAEGMEEDACHALVDLYEKEHNDKYKLVWTEPFFPAAELNINTESVGRFTDYRRSLNFSNGEATVQFKTDDRLFSRRAFISRTAQACIIHLDSGDVHSNYELSLSQPAMLEEDTEFFASFFGAEPGFIPHEADNRHAAVLIREFQETQTGYAVVATVVDCDGDFAVNRESITIQSAKSVVLLVSVIRIDDIRTFCVEDEIRRLLDLPVSYARLLHEHEAVHKERYERISLRLDPAADQSECDDETLYKDAREADAASSAFLEKIFNAGRYEILSSCGARPPNLQGVWAGSYRVPWCSDYTQNGNLQTAIAGLLPSGDFESMRSYFDFQEANLAHYRENSRKLYGCRGIHIPSRTSANGYDIHYSTSYPMLFWTAGAAWAAHFYFDYWLYTGDDNFFKKRALPFMKEAALFYEDFLIEGTDGCWLFSPSYSPENTPFNRKSPGAVNATMDIAVAKELFTNLITGCRSLGLEDEPIHKWQRMLAKMPAYQINEDGALKEWAAPQYEENYDHRHASQLYMLYYDMPAEFRQNRVLYAACEKAYRMKRELKKNEQGTMAFGLVQMGMAAAHVQDAEMVEAMLQSMAKNNYYSTFASSHDYGPSLFNADISGGVPALILESIAQCSPVTDKHGVIVSYDIQLLPALPKSMPSGHLKGLRMRGGMILDLSWRNGSIMDYTVHNPLQIQYRIVNA